jgi:hypothetical protein
MDRAIPSWVSDSPFVRLEDALARLIYAAAYASAIDGTFAGSFPVRSGVVASLVRPIGRVLGRHAESRQRAGDMQEFASYVVCLIGTFHRLPFAYFLSASDAARYVRARSNLPSIQARICLWRRDDRDRRRFYVSPARPSRRPAHRSIARAGTRVAVMGQPSRSREMDDQARLSTPVAGQAFGERSDLSWPRSDSGPVTSRGRPAAAGRAF